MYRNGWFQQQAGQLDAAQAAYARAIAMGKPGRDDWAVYWSKLGTGDIQKERGNLGAALATYRDAAMIAERLAKAAPGNAGWQRDLSWSYNKVGDVQVAQGDLAGALTSYRDSLATRERLAKADLGNAGWQRDIAVSYSKIAGVLRQQGENATGKATSSGTTNRSPPWRADLQPLHPARSASGINTSLTGDRPICGPC
jgi:tetratricopeptide (TPR) repeat protein